MTTAVLVALGLMAPAASAISFTNPVRLIGAAGGDPRIVTGRSGDALVSGTRGPVAGANGSAGVALWRSISDGRSFERARSIPSKTGGGQDSPSASREWLTPAPDGTRYLTYRHFVAPQPVGFRSDRGDRDDFSHACGSLITDPTIAATVPTDITGSAFVSKPVTDAQGNLYVLFSTSTQREDALAEAPGQLSGTFSQLYLAVSHDRCRTFSDHTVLDGEGRDGENTVQLGDIFNDLAIDGAGHLYVVGAGYVGHTPFARTANVYLLHSDDHGQTWSAPERIGHGPAAAMLPAAAGGSDAGQLSIGYYRTVNGITDPDNAKAEWTYTTAQSNDADRASPRFLYRDVKPGFVYHWGEICNEGIRCGAKPRGPSDRSLLDFTSAAVDAHGCTLYAFAGNPTGSPGHNTAAKTFNYVSRQTSHCFPTRGSGSLREAGESQDPTPCPRASGRLSAPRLGRLAVGMTRRRARHLMVRFAVTHNGFDNYCLRAGWGIRAGYPSLKLLSSLSRSVRRRSAGRVSIALTANPHYALDGVRPQAKLTGVARKLHLQRAPFKVGANSWYVLPGRVARGVLKVRAGRVQEVGLVARSLTNGHAAQRRLFWSLDGGGSPPAPLVRRPSQTVQQLERATLRERFIEVSAFR